MLSHTCIPLPSTKIPRVVSHLDLEDEAVDPTGLEARHARNDRIIFQTPSMAQVTLELTKAEGKKPLI